jgi:hypothetical protein
MTTLSRIRDGVVANLRTAYPDGVQVGKYALANPSPPTLQILAGGITYHLAMHGGLHSVTLTIQGLAMLSDNGQELLDEWMDVAPGGVKDAVEVDRSLGGSCDDLIVRSVAPVRIAIVGGIDYLLAEWTVEIYPQGV